MKETSRWPLVGLLLVTATAGYLCRVNISTAAALLMKEFSLSQAEMGPVFSAFLLGYALCQIPAGAVADRFGAKRTLAVAALAWTALTVAQSAVSWNVVLLLLVLRFLLGVTAAPTYPGAAAGISRWVPASHQGRATGIVLASIGLGSALAPPLVSSMMVRFGWRVALAVSAVPAFVAALLWTRMAESPSRPSRMVPPRARDSGASARLRGWSFFLLTASYSLQGYLGYIFVFWLYLYLVQERKFGLLEGAWVASLPWLLSIVSIPLGGFLSDRLVAGRLGPVWGRRLVPILGLGLAGILTSVGAHTQSPAVAVVSLALATASVLSVEGPFWATMMGLAGGKSGTAGGIMNTGSNLGGLISPTLTPLLAERMGWENALHLAGALGLVAAALWLGIVPEHEDPAIG